MHINRLQFVGMEMNLPLGMLSADDSCNYRVFDSRARHCMGQWWF